MAKEVTVIVAEATVQDDVAFRLDAPSDVDLDVGDTLRVRMSYSLHDQSKPEELWTVRLITRIDDDEEAVSERIHRDRKLLSDDVMSNLGVDLHFPKSGTYRLDFEAFAQLAHRDWDAEEGFQPVVHKTETGTVNVRVA